MHERHTDKQLYFKEQVYTTEKHVIPFIRKAAPIEAGMTVLEIGCGEGGNLKPFLDLGCRVTGIDISQSKIESARVTTAVAEQTTVAAFRPWRGS